MPVRPWDQPVRYGATARIISPSGGATLVATPDDLTKPLLACSPLAAARKWYWRLDEDERAACDLVIVSPFRGPPIFPSYGGPVVRFAPREDWREIEAADEPSLPRSFGV